MLAQSGISTKFEKFRQTLPIIVAVVSGVAAMRGTCFKDRTHCTVPEKALHLATLHLSFPEPSSMKHFGRGFGVIRDPSDDEAVGCETRCSVGGLLRVDDGGQHDDGS